MHGGVRYLEQLNLTLVLDALRERGHMLRNAPHLVHDLSFVVPAYSYVSLPYYGVGLKVYERLSGHSPSAAPNCSRAKTRSIGCPEFQSDGLRGGILYHDGQFDDARYAIALMRTFQDLGGTAINYVEATGLLIERAAKSSASRPRDREDGAVFDLQAKAVINACGVFSEETLDVNGPRRARLAACHQPGHRISFCPATFLPGNTALMIPKTADGRVLFAIPWHGATIVGTTDVARRSHLGRTARARIGKAISARPHHRYIGRAPRPKRSLSVWSGLRPLVKKSGVKTSKLSRDHTILVSHPASSRSPAASGPPIAAWARTPSIAPCKLPRFPRLHHRLWS